MRRLLFGLVTTAQLFVSASVLAQVPESTDREELTREIQRFLEQYAERMAMLDVEGLVDMYSASLDFFWLEANRRHTYETRDELAAGLSGLERQFESLTLEFEILRIVPLGSTTAIVVFRFCEMLTPAVGASFILEGVITATLTREESRWRFLTGHSTGEISQVEG